MTKSDYSLKYISMKILCRLLLIIVLFSFSGNHLKGQTSVPMQTVVATAVDSLHNQLISELDEKYKFKAYYLDNQEKTVDWWIDVLGILVAFFGVIVPIALLIFANKQSRLNKKELDKIDNLKEKVEAKVDKTIHESKTELNGMIDRADHYLDKIWENKKESDKILNENRKYISSKPDNGGISSNTTEQKSEEYLNPEDQIMLNETNETDALNSLCKLADSYLIIPNRLDEARAIWNIIVKDFKLDKKDIAFAYYKMAEIERRDKTGADLTLKIFTLIDLAIQLDPENEYYYSKRAEIFQVQGEFGKAENDYSNAIKISKADRVFLYYWNRGYVKRLQGNIDGAIKDYNEAISQNSEFSELYKSRAKAYLMKLDYPNAFNDFLSAYHFAPFDNYSIMNAFEMAILLEKHQESSYLKGKIQDDESTIVDYLNLLYGIVIGGQTEFNLEALKAKLKDYKFMIDWSFDVAKDRLSAIGNETATRLMAEYEQLINDHNGRIKTI